MQLLKDLSANRGHEMDADAVQFVNSPKPETHWDSRAGCGFCHLICGKSRWSKGTATDVFIHTFIHLAYRL